MDKVRKKRQRANRAAAPTAKNAKPAEVKKSAAELSAAAEKTLKSLESDVFARAEAKKGPKLDAGAALNRLSNTQVQQLTLFAVALEKIAEQKDILDAQELTAGQLAARETVTAGLDALQSGAILSVMEEKASSQLAQQLTELHGQIVHSELSDQDKQVLGLFSRAMEQIASYGA